MAVPTFSRASGFGPLAAMIVSQHGEAALDGLAARFGAALTAERSTPVPFEVMNGLFEFAAAQMDDPLLGARVGAAMAVEDYGPFAAYAVAATTLGEAIARFHAVQRVQTTATAGRLRRRGATAMWLQHYTDRRGGTVHWQHATHLLSVGIDTVRRFVPRANVELMVEVSDPGLLNRLSQLFQLPVTGGRSGFGVAFPAVWLDRVRPIIGDATIPAEQLAYYLDKAMPTRMTDATIAAINLHSETGFEADIDMIATSLGRQRRTLQLSLQAEGVTYRDLLRVQRMQHAKSMLATRGMSIAEVAVRSGYSDQAHFHRAFHAVTGETPSAFRRQIGLRPSTVERLVLGTI